MISLHELADECRVHIDDLRARLHQANIGASGHGDVWQARVRALVAEICKETGGVMGGQVVVEAHNDDARAGAACQTLRQRLQFIFANLPEGNLNAQQLEDARNTPFKVWLARERHEGPQGGYEHMGWALHVAIPPDAHPAAWRIIHDLPTQLDGLDLFACAWDEAPDNQPKGN